MMHANKQENHARRRLGLVLALVGLMSAATPATGPIRPASAQTDAPSWSYTGSLKRSHPRSSAMLLPDGKVLVVGGSHEVELYDPSTGTWSVNGTLTLTSRSDYTAVLLGNGKVLVAGGTETISDDEAPLTNSAELYDPATGESHFTGSLNVRSVGQTATLLPNGKVLFAGGVTQESTTNTAELYDPATGQWSLTGNLSTARSGHTAALLQNGKVLVAGGNIGQGNTASAEVDDPNTETWRSTGSLNTPRGGHTLTTLPNGNLLVSGGAGDAEIYNPATGLWSTTGSLNTARSHHTATLLSTGQVLVVGGIAFIGQGESKSAELYDQATGTFKTTADLNTGRYDHTATLLTNGKVLVVGGGLIRRAELYHPGMLVPDPTDPRILLASVSGKKLFITGENFHAGAVILLNGETQKTKQPAANPHTTLIGKKAGKKIRPGDTLQVRNPDGTLSEEFIFTGSQD